MTMEDKYREWFRGDEAAVRFAIYFWSALQEWDDLEDEGKCDHNALLSWLAFGKEYDPFFARFAHVLRPAFLSVYLQWRAANVLDHEKDHCPKAYMLRAGLYGFYHMMAWCIGGDDWAAEVGPDIYRQYGETLDDLMREMGHMEEAA